MQSRSSGQRGRRACARERSSFLSGVVIGVASTAPGYSLAAVLGGIALVAGIGIHAPAIILISFIPMLFIAAAFYYLNKADPDCGTTFSWATRAFGPWVGWMAGWAVLAADIIVMANLADIAGLYSWLLIGQDAPSRLAVMTVGIIWMVGMTVICYIGIEASARTQYGLLGDGAPDARDLLGRRALEGLHDGHRRLDPRRRSSGSTRSASRRARSRPA